MPVLHAALKVLLLLAAHTPAWGHHNLITEFDMNRSIELRGTVARLDWANPHIALFLEVEGEDGDIEIWECELGSPNPLIQSGWDKEDLPEGAVIRVKANPARDGSPNCSSRNLHLDDGTPIFTRFSQR